jgi:three-Cys-motif partner protein
MERNAMNSKQETLFEIGSPVRSRKPKGERHYEWQVNGTPPTLGRHSLAKHRILSQYLQKYVQVLTRKKVIEGLKLTLVDGFAGGGLYLHPDTGTELPGSPIIMVNSMQEAEYVAKQSRKKNFTLDVQYIFVEERKETQEFLKKQLADCKAGVEQADRIAVLPGSFSTHLDSILEAVKKRGRSRRVIFVLDQYGFTDVSMMDLQKIFHDLPNAEVILTIATDWLVDYWSEKNYETILPNLGISLTPEFANQVKREHPNDWRPIIQHALHMEFKLQSGAGFYTPFFIHSTESHRAYWLLHFSGHAKARDVMTELHHELQNHFQHFGSPGIDMLNGMFGFDPRRIRDPQQTMLSYDFDESSRQLTHDALVEQIPQVLPATGISFQRLFETLVNSMPGTRSMLMSAVQDLTKLNQLEVIATNRRIRNKGVSINSQDIIQRCNQQTCFSMQQFSEART